MGFWGGFGGVFLVFLGFFFSFSGVSVFSDNCTGVGANVYICTNACKNVYIIRLKKYDILGFTLHVFSSLFNY